MPDNCTLQKIKHYEIATYGCLRTYASLLGFER
jgi:ferritin-like metal-binding protein YciE